MLTCMGCDFTQTTFESCHLNGAIVNEETLFEGADLRGAQISNLHLEKASLKGAIMSTIQAHYLLHRGIWNSYSRQLGPTDGS